MVVALNKQTTAQIIVVDVSLAAKKQTLWNHSNRKKYKMNKENKNLVAILDKATSDGWECSLKTTKQCNSENTLIMLMTTKLYREVSAETHNLTDFDDAAKINSNHKEPAKSPSGSDTGSAYCFSTALTYLLFLSPQNQIDRYEQKILFF